MNLVVPYAERKIREVGFLDPPGPHYWLNGNITAEWLSQHGYRAESYLFWTMEQARQLVRRSPRRCWVVQTFFEPDLRPILDLKSSHMDGLVALLDDDIWNPPPWITKENLSYPTPHGVFAVEALLRAADHVVTRTPVLEGIARRFNANVSTIHYAHGPELPQATTERQARKSIRIGWGGSGTHDGDLDMIQIPLLRIMAKYDVTVVFFTGIPYWAHVLWHSSDPRGRRLEMYAGQKITMNQRSGLCLTDHPEYLRFIADRHLDIFMAPLVDHPYNVARDHVKALDAFSLGLPLIASDVGPYRRQLTHMDSAYLVENTSEAWEQGLSALIESEALRHKLAARGREWFNNVGTINTWGPEWVKVLDRVMD